MKRIFAIIVSIFALYSRAFGQWNSEPANIVLHYERRISETQFSELDLYESGQFVRREAGSVTVWKIGEEKMNDLNGLIKKVGPDSDLIPAVGESLPEGKAELSVFVPAEHGREKRVIKNLQSKTLQYRNSFEARQLEFFVQDLRRDWLDSIE